MVPVNYIVVSKEKLKRCGAVRFPNFTLLGVWRPQLHDDSLPALTFYGYTAKYMTTIGSTVGSLLYVFFFNNSSV